MPSTSTEIVFRKFREGDIEPFYRSLYRDMLLYATSCLAGKMAVMAEDCVQYTVEKAYERRDAFESPAQWKAFMLTCIRNQSISLYRGNASAMRYSEAVLRLEEVHEDIMLDYIRRETLQRLYEAIDSLPGDMRELLQMSFEEGLRNREIAERLGVAEITVKKRKAKLIATLRKLLPDNSALVLLVAIMLK